jgi:hypothetical protein
MKLTIPNYSYHSIYQCFFARDGSIQGSTTVATVQSRKAGFIGAGMKIGMIFGAMRAGWVDPSSNLTFY